MNQSRAAVAIIIIKDHKHLLELTLVMLTNNLEDLGQSFIGEYWRQRGHSVDEGVGTVFS